MDVKVLTFEQEKTKALSLCAEFLGGIWGNVSEDDFSFNVFPGGMSNRLYVCGVPEGDGFDAKCVPKRVLLRYFGSQYIARDIPFKTTGEAAEDVIFYALSRQGLGPTLYGVFSGGRLEQFIASHRLRNEEILSPDISGIIGKKLAQIHCLEMPIINKEPMKWFEIVEKFCKIRQPFEVPSKYEKFTGQVVTFDVMAEITMLKDMLPKIKAKNVFCHNDTNCANILIREEEGAEAEAGSKAPMSLDDRVVLIDYEYASYGYRGMDIANHLLSRRFDYSNPAYPFSGLGYPSETEKRHFIREYLAEYRRIGSTAAFSGIDSEANVLMETEYFSLVCAVMGLSVVLSMLGRPEMNGFYEYADVVLTLYLKQKEAFFMQYTDRL